MVKTCHSQKPPSLAAQKLYTLIFEKKLCNVDLAVIPR